jgi:predicted esterase
VFAEAGAGELVCARADIACPAGGAMWSSGPRALSRIEAAVESAAESSEGRLDPNAPRVLVGFSQGAYVALRAVRRAPGRYPSVLLIGAFVKPTRKELEAAGVVRLTLAAGDLDGSAATMRASAARLRREGFDARFVSLGRVGHTYVGDAPEKLAGALAWTIEGVPREPRASN